MTKNFGSAGQSYLEVNGGPVIYNTGTVYSNDNKWHNISFATDDYFGISLYIDGILKTKFLYPEEAIKNNFLDFLFSYVYKRTDCFTVR